VYLWHSASAWHWSHGALRPAAIEPIHASEMAIGTDPGVGNEALEKPERLRDRFPALAALSMLATVAIAAPPEPSTQESESKLKTITIEAKRDRAMHTEHDDRMQLSEITRPGMTAWRQTRAPPRASSRDATGSYQRGSKAALAPSSAAYKVLMTCLRPRSL